MMRVRPFKPAHWMLALLVGIGGCAVGTPPPQDRFYRLVLAPAPAADATLLPGAIAVARPQADAVRGQRAIAYCECDRSQALHHYHYRLWTDTPPVLVQQALIDRLRARGVAPVVFAERVGAPARYRLVSSIRSFEQVVDGGRAHVEVALELALIRMPEREIVWVDAYRSRQPAADAGVEAAVEAFGAALSEVLDAFVADVQRHAPAYARGPRD